MRRHTLFSKHFDIHSDGFKILDWGCGPGSIVRHFPEILTEAHVYGTDYNEEYIRWCGENLNRINFSVNQIDPPTKYKNSFFDAVIGLSIFTHLSEKNHFDWINELYRFIKFGGGTYYYTRKELLFKINQAREEVI